MGLEHALRSYLDRGLTFACFRRPGRPFDLWVQRSPDLDVVDHAMLYELNEVFLLAPFLLDPSRIAFIRADKDFVITDPSAEVDPLIEFRGRKVPASPDPFNTPDALYKQHVRNALEAFERSDLEKVVLSRTVTSALERQQLPQLFLAAAEAYPQAFVALVNTPDHGTWLGASPERSLSAQDDTLQVDAIAATRSGQRVPADPDQWNEKERHEQALVTTGVLAELIDLGLRETRTHGPEVVHAGNVAHLRTVVEADLGGRALSEVVLALHPTAAVCGTPREAAMAFIAATERHERSLYSGFWGPWSADGETELFVNLRCMQAHGTAVTLFVGAGIVPGSDPEQEWEETEHKANTWRDLMASFSDRVSSRTDAHQ
ncbi:MAG: chorismate-binding protein [Flavobacteriales bacterium]|nr:chorismate-binding protein [Flavobacteriales bacterium]